MTLTLLHTSDAHVPTFAALRDRIAPGAPLEQAVQADWLEEARRDGVTADLARRVTDFVAAAPGPVICTCTTLGPAAEPAGATRIDRPMMQAAAQYSGPILMAYALESTAEPSRALLAEYVAPARIVPLDLCHLWPAFEAGDADTFAKVIAEAVRDAAKRQDFGAIILAQASMAGARNALADLACPVLASPEIALRHGLAV